MKMIVSLYMLLFIPGDKYADVKQFTDEDVEYIVQFVDGLLHEYENQLTEVKVRLRTSKCVEHLIVVYLQYFFLCFLYCVVMMYYL